MMTGLVSVSGSLRTRERCGWSFPICITGLFYMLMKKLRGVALTFSACCPLYWLQETVEMSPTGIAWLSHLIENVGCYDFKCIAIWPLASLQNEQQWCSAEHQLTDVVGRAQQFCENEAVLLKCNEPKNKISFSCSTSAGSHPGHVRSFSVLLWVWKVFTQHYGHTRERNILA